MLLTLLSKRAPAASSPMSLILKATDTTPAGSTDAFLSTRLEYTTDEHGQEICLVKVADEEEVGVMMGWERGISESKEHHPSSASTKWASAKCRKPCADCARIMRTWTKD